MLMGSQPGIEFYRHMNNQGVRGDEQDAEERGGGRRRGGARTQVPLIRISPGRKRGCCAIML